ncbi:Arsenical resistance operon trans-acting repressor ArsD [Alkaliphilus metalliredigens QYMF]|uniref:Arsenical resistance operon trans-acting repressor ArsD n=1 Tax=Alkaliphilus metalliredigens (strain QYMF) TaxID=293826 RepID=A6TP81_ALKMQ|nr:arsenite efflux transporter metallochaperone ArsD [Alkaliphilus metalliredigens]ABR47999.1 Arsenical resistance operon trans-acting repressor ArsD [Alkaliphilus metalliredigens QYMF]
MKIEIYDPPMCCSSGICGPSVDDTLIKLNENIEIIKNKYPDASVERYMITQQPLKFRENEAVYKMIKEKGREILPITTIDGKIIKYNEYPTLDEIQTYL